MSIYRWTDREDVAHIYNGILLCLGFWQHGHYGWSWFDPLRCGGDGERSQVRPPGGGMSPVCPLWTYRERIPQWALGYHAQPSDSAFTAIPHLFERAAFVASDTGFMWKAEKEGFVKHGALKMGHTAGVRSPPVQTWLHDSLCHLGEFIQPPFTSLFMLVKWRGWIKISCFLNFF